MITYNYNSYGSDFPFTSSKQIKTNLEVLLKMLDEEDIKQYKEMIFSLRVDQDIDRRELLTFLVDRQ